MIMSSRRVLELLGSGQSRGTIDNVRGYEAPRRCSTRSSSSGHGPPKRPPIVDRVLQSYKDLRSATSGCRRRQARLDDHMARIAELERKLTAKASCGDVMMPTDDAQNHNGDTEKDPSPTPAVEHVVTAAFVWARVASVCSATAHDKFVAYGGDWHQEVAHQCSSGKTRAVKHSYQRVFEGIFLIWRQLDIEERPADLPRQLAARLEQECGMSTHDSVTIPSSPLAAPPATSRLAYSLTTGASAIRFDFRSDGGGKQYLGLLYNQWSRPCCKPWAAASDFERWATRLGVPTSRRELDAPYKKHYTERRRATSPCQRPLPLIKA